MYLEVNDLLAVSDDDPLNLDSKFAILFLSEYKKLISNGVMTDVGKYLHYKIQSRFLDYLQLQHSVETPQDLTEIKNLISQINESLEQFKDFSISKSKLLIDSLEPISLQEVFSGLDYGNDFNLRLSNVFSLQKNINSYFKIFKDFNIDGILTSDYHTGDTTNAITLLEKYINEYDDTINYTGKGSYGIGENQLSFQNQESLRFSPTLNFLLTNEKLFENLAAVNLLILNSQKGLFYYDNAGSENGIIGMPLLNLDLDEGLRKLFFFELPAVNGENPIKIDVFNVSANNEMPKGRNFLVDKVIDSFSLSTGTFDRTTFDAFKSYINVISENLKLFLELFKPSNEISLDLKRYLINPESQLAKKLTFNDASTLANPIWESRNFDEYDRGIICLFTYVKEILSLPQDPPVGLFSQVYAYDESFQTSPFIQNNFYIRSSVAYHELFALAFNGMFLNSFPAIDSFCLRLLGDSEKYGQGEVGYDTFDSFQTYTNLSATNLRSLGKLDESGTPPTEGFISSSFMKECFKNSKLWSTIINVLKDYRDLITNVNIQSEGYEQIECLQAIFSVIFSIVSNSFLDLNKVHVTSFLTAKVKYTTYYSKTESYETYSKGSSFGLSYSNKIQTSGYLTKSSYYTKENEGPIITTTDVNAIDYLYTRINNLFYHIDFLASQLADFEQILLNKTYDKISLLASYDNQEDIKNNKSSKILGTLSKLHDIQNLITTEKIQKFYSFNTLEELNFLKPNIHVLDCSIILNNKLKDAILQHMSSWSDGTILTFSVPQKYNNSGVFKLTTRFYDELSLDELYTQTNYFDSRLYPCWDSIMNSTGERFKWFTNFKAENPDYTLVVKNILDYSNSDVTPEVNKSIIDSHKSSFYLDLYLSNIFDSKFDERMMYESNNPLIVKSGQYLTTQSSIDEIKHYIIAKNKFARMFHIFVPNNSVITEKSLKRFQIFIE